MSDKTKRPFTKTYIQKEVLPKQSKLAPGQQYFYWHPEVHGLALKLTPTKAVYIVQRRVKDGREEKNVRVVIGNYFEMTIEQAKDKAVDKLREMRAGVNPVTKRKAEVIAGKTLQNVLDDYLSKYSTRLRPKTQEVYRSAIRRCFADWLETPITRITEHQVEDRQIELSNANGPRGKGEAQANSAMRVLRTLFYFAMLEYRDSQGNPIIVTNPVSRLKKRRLWNEAKHRDEIIEDEKLATWYQAVMQLENDTWRDYFLLCLFTGLRRGEASKLKWDNILYKGSKPILVVPAIDTKTNSEHKLPLPDFLVALLRDRDKVRSITNPYVFPGEKPNSHITDPKDVIKRVIDATKRIEMEKGEGGIGVDFSMHTLRRTFSTVAGKLDISVYKHKKLMNHSTKADVTGAHYVALKVEDLRDPMQKIAASLMERCGICDAATAQPPAKFAR